MWVSVDSVQSSTTFIINASDRIASFDSRPVSFLIHVITRLALHSFEVTTDAVKEERY